MTCWVGVPLAVIDRRQCQWNENNRDVSLLQSKEKVKYLQKHYIQSNISNIVGKVCKKQESIQSNCSFEISLYTLAV